MAYDKKKIFEQAKEVITKHKLFFIEDVVAFLPITKKTYYEWWPVGGDESDQLKELLDENKTTLKVSMRKKWFDSDNATLQMALMKLISTPEELRKLSMNHIEQNVSAKVETKLIRPDGSEWTVENNEDI